MRYSRLNTGRRGKAADEFAGLICDTDALATAIMPNLEALAGTLNAGMKATIPQARTTTAKAVWTQQYERHLTGKRSHRAYSGDQRDRALSVGKIEAVLNSEVMDPT